ncbi:bleomycin resistance protein [Acinetobacter rudis]|uniref:bleomycin resistance protein n=1 Tax=Acinetobacter rudis TaxID=632955 RepID=UPI00333EDE60
MQYNKLVPELIVSDLVASRRFWIDYLGFDLSYERVEEGFVYLDLAGVQFMLEQVQEDQWVTAELSVPFGRGINFQMEVTALAPILSRLAQANWPLFAEPEERWYRADHIEHGQRQFLVQDPDGYLLRLVEVLGERPISALPSP